MPIETNTPAPECQMRLSPKRAAPFLSQVANHVKSRSRARSGTTWLATIATSTANRTMAMRPIVASACRPDRAGDERFARRRAVPAVDQEIRDRELRRDDELTARDELAHLGGAEPSRVGELATDRDRLARGFRLEAEHQRGGERPGLRRDVARARDRDAGFLAHFAHDRLLERLPRLDEARERRVALLGPRGLPAEQTALAVRDERDDRGVGPREVL